MLSTNSTRNIVFIDSKVADYNSLLENLFGDIEVCLLNDYEDGILQIANILKRRSNLDAIHIISHGSSGSLFLGSTTLDNSDLSQYADVLKNTIGSSLTDNGDILLYGCNVAQGINGESFIEQLAQITGADVAASNDLTGAANLGGDWTLEAVNVNGTIEATTFNIAGYNGVLAVPQVLTGNNTSIFVRPGGISYTWTYGLGLSPPNLTTNAQITDVSYYNVDFPAPTADWILTRGKFQYSTNGGSTWTDYAYPAAGNTNFVSVSGKIWRFVDNQPSDTTNSNNVGFGYYVTGFFGQSVGTGATINPDNAPTDITASNYFILSDSTQGTFISTLTPTDTGLSTGGYWAIDSQTNANLFTVTFNATTGNTANLQIGTGTLPSIGSTTTVNARYYDIYQTNSSGSPIAGQGFSKPLTLTVVNAQSQDLSFGNDLNISVTAANNQIAPAVTTLSNGNFVTVWQSDGQDGETAGKNGIYGHIYDALGNTVGNDFAITTIGNNIDETTPVVAALNSGRFVVAYAKSPGTSGVDIAYRIVAANGTVGSELIANTTTANDQYSPSITTLTDGSFVITWATYSSDFSSAQIRAQKFNAVDGSKNGSELSFTTSGLNVYPSVAALSNGAYAIAWGDGIGGNIKAVVSTAPSTIIPVTNDGAAFSYYTGYPLPKVTGLTGGGFVVAWDSYANDLTNFSQTDIFFQRYNNSGTAQGSITRANSSSATNQYRGVATVDGLSGGGFVVGWQSDTGDYDQSGVFGRRFSSTGVAVDANDFEINQFRRGDQNSPAITALASDSFATVWVDNSSDGTSNAGIEGRVLLAGDTTPPAAPSTPDLVTGSDSGFSNTDNVTNATTPTFTGTAEANSTVTLFQGGSTQIGSATADGAGNWTITASTLASGNYSITAKATDAANNVSVSSASLAITIDAIPPTVTNIDDGDADNIVTVGNALTYTLTFSEDIDSATVTAADFNNAGTATISIGTITETSPGVFTVVVTPSTSGTIILRIPNGAVIRDVAGNNLAVPVQDGDAIGVNSAPTAVNLTPIFTSILENTDTTTRIKVADVSITDDALGTNNLSVSGIDASFFEVDATGLYIKANTVLNYEAKTSFSVTVNVDDSTVGSNPDATTTYSLSVTDINENPSVFGFSAATYNVNEDGTTSIPITINRTTNTIGAASVTVNLGGGTATATTDYNNSPITVNFADGEASKTVVVPIVLDNITESTETVNLSLTNPTGAAYGATVGGNTSSVLSIIDFYNRPTSNQDETIIAPSGSSVVNVSTGSGNDTINLSNRTGNIVASAGLGNDSVFGGSGNDVLSGGDGDDIIKGNAGVDRLFGDAANDTLYGGLGNDQLTGGTGTDIFALETTSGSDIILDFVSGTDYFGYTGSLNFGSLAFNQSGLNTQIFSGGSLLATVLNVNLSTINNASNFVQL